ncbi:zinc finger CCCH domain-containing protein 41 [Cornus florida]|uniref:zinc finger CCCH domain-containing protein 41 n=1 Tax=Cornus florida TaxID=4283 RepID=UPI00289A2782|nr:zinc finger CCCH domain-containing protein 41 [Cornus florida]XP_059643521.1 zinc finger CCCH domain-containing protein 41 [Cornus florida]
MELEVSSPKAGVLLPSDCVSDPEEKEISDDDDDDRNHKHRRWETRSQSLERDALDQVLTRPYRKRNRPFENRHPYRENDSLEKDLSAKFDKRRPGLAIYSRAPLDLNQRIGVNQSSSTETGPGRGRGREFGSWSHLDSRFSSVEIATQMVQQRSVPPSLFAGRGLPNVSHAPNASWSAFGLTSGIPNGGLDTLHSLGLQGTLRPPINASLNMGIARQRCRDFEERGFCLRGDMCPMEHGVNRIVVEDVQSLSQFNLPVSLPSAHLLGTPGSLPSVSAPSSSSMNSKGLHSKISKPGTVDNGLGLNGGFTGYVSAGGADFYDPDQPLWTNDCPEPSTVLHSLNPSKVDETESSLDIDPSDHNHVGLCDGSDNKRPIRSTATAAGPQNTSLSVWGRIGGSKNRTEIIDKIDSTINSSNNVENEAREYQEPLTSPQGAARQGKRTIADGIGSQAMDSSLKTQGDIAHNIRKPSQKALRTLFVNGIPHKNNKREALLSHFQKFGEVIDIYIPLNSERAFVQFSKREEAEAALKAPDAVMGNRFIKLWWANRDSVPDHGMSSGNNVSITPRAVKVASVPSYPFVANKEKDGAPEATVAHVVIPASDQPKPLVTNSPKAPPSSQKKLESLELLKEELRKKQEMLDQKRNDFRRQLDKLEKQTTGLKGEVASEQATKRLKVGTVADFSIAATLKSNNPGTVLASPQVEAEADNKKSAENVVHHHSNSKVALQEPSSLKQSVRPLAPAGAPFIMNRFKLDNRPTAFKIVPPLPTGFANVTVLREHFSIYGDLSTIELEDLESDDSETKNGSAHISFITRRSAEQAFVNGKCWQGHNLQFTWLMPNKSSNDNGSRENPPAAYKGLSETNMQPASEVASTVSQESADPPSASKGPLDADMQPAEVVLSTVSHEAGDPPASKGPSDTHMQLAGEVSSIVSQEVAVSGNGSSENMEGREWGGPGGEHMEWEEDFQSSSSAMSSEKQSPPKGNVC